MKASLILHVFLCGCKPTFMSFRNGLQILWSGNSQDLRVVLASYACMGMVPGNG